MYSKAELIQRKPGSAKPTPNPLLASSRSGSTRAKVRDEQPSKLKLLSIRVLPLGKVFLKLCYLASLITLLSLAITGYQWDVHSHYSDDFPISSSIVGKGTFNTYIGLSWLHASFDGDPPVDVKWNPFGIQKTNVKLEQCCRRAFKLETLEYVYNNARDLDGQPLGMLQIVESMLYPNDFYTRYKFAGMWAEALLWLAFAINFFCWTMWALKLYKHAAYLHFIVSVVVGCAILVWCLVKGDFAYTKVHIGRTAVNFKYGVHFWCAIGACGCSLFHAIWMYSLAAYRKKLGKKAKASSGINRDGVEGRNVEGVEGRKVDGRGGVGVKSEDDKRGIELSPVSHVAASSSYSSSSLSSPSSSSSSSSSSFSSSYSASSASSSTFSSSSSLASTISNSSRTNPPAFSSRGLPHPSITSHQLPLSDSAPPTPGFPQPSSVSSSGSNIPPTPSFNGVNSPEKQPLFTDLSKLDLPNLAESGRDKSGSFSQDDPLATPKIDEREFVSRLTVDASSPEMRNFGPKIGDSVPMMQFPHSSPSPSPSLSEDHLGSPPSSFFSSPSSSTLSSSSSSSSSALSRPTIDVSLDIPEEHSIDTPKAGSVSSSGGLLSRWSRILSTTS